MAEYIAAFIIAAIVIAIVVYCYLPRGGTPRYKCPKCGMVFTREPGPAAMHFFDFIDINCPYCGLASFMRRQRR